MDYLDELMNALKKEDNAEKERYIMKQQKLKALICQLQKYVGDKGTTEPSMDSIAICELFIQDYIDNMINPKVHRISTQELYDKFVEWCRIEKKTIGVVTLSIHKFTRLINTMDGITRTTIRTENETTYTKTQKRAYEIDPDYITLEEEEILE